MNRVLKKLKDFRKFLSRISGSDEALNDYGYCRVYFHFNSHSDPHRTVL